MSKKIIFEGAAVQPETREFFLKMAKLAYDDELNVTLTEQRRAETEYSGMAAGVSYQDGVLNICIWKEVETAFDVVKNPPST